MRTFLKITLSYLCVTLWGILEPFCHFSDVAVLAYHSISSDNSDTSITPITFEKQVRFLKKKGVTFVSLTDVLAWRLGKAQLPRKAVAITFDDGYADFETEALPILIRYSIPATLFMVGDIELSREWVCNAIPFLSREALTRVSQNSLVSLGYHSRTHANLAKLTNRELVSEIVPTFATTLFAYPGGNRSPEAVAVVKEAGYEAAFGIGWNITTQNSDLFSMPRSVITQSQKLWEIRFRTTRAVAWYRFIIKTLLLIQ